MSEMSAKQPLRTAAAVWIVAAALLALAPAVRAQHNRHPDDVKICYVDQLKYTNKTANYNVLGVYLLWMSEGTLKSEEGLLGPTLKKNQSYTIDINTLTAGPQGLYLQDGEEVWPAFLISLGERKTCHKEGHKLVYKKDIARLIHFRSSGTTKNNNNCEYAENIANQCDGSLPD